MQRTIGKNVRFLRESNGYSQEELAEKAGIHRSYIGHIERGEGNITISNLCKIAEALSIHPGVLLFEETFAWKNGPG
jgi:transcriptional regulator with XRE-family HTH domain